MRISISPLQGERRWLLIHPDARGLPRRKVCRSAISVRLDAAMHFLRIPEQVPSASYRTLPKNQPSLRKRRARF